VDARALSASVEANKLSKAHHFKRGDEFGVFLFRAVFWVVLPCFTRQYNPEDSSEHHTRRRENLKSHIGVFLFHRRSDDQVKGRAEYCSTVEGHSVCPCTLHRSPLASHIVGTKRSDREPEHLFLSSEMLRIRGSVPPLSYTHINHVLRRRGSLSWGTPYQSSGALSHVGEKY
jgi:hypothetical protein